MKCTSLIHPISIRKVLLIRFFNQNFRAISEKSILSYLSGVMSILLLLPACGNDVSTLATEECVSGIIVGEKCGVVAFKPVIKGALGAQLWEKETIDQQHLIRIENVIGIIGLTNEFKENDQAYLKLRKATEEEELSLACYQDLPGPPKPMYVVIKYNSSSCPD